MDREKAMWKMIKQAFSNEKGKRVSTFMTPKKELIIKSSQFQQIDLIQRNITEDSARADSRAQVVRERFGRLSVAAAVQSAFEGKAIKDLPKAAQARQT